MVTRRPSLAIPSPLQLVWRAALVAVGLLLAQTPVASQTSSTFQSVIAKAREQADSGNLTGARDSFQQALRMAGAPKEQGEAALALAGLEEDALALRKDKPDRILAEINSLYSKAVNQATGTSRLLAHNNYAAFLTRNNNPHEAVQLLGAIERGMTANDDAEAQARYSYNFGRALEATNQRDQAFERYRNAVELYPVFDRAAEAAIDLALRDDNADRGVKRLAGLVTTLTDKAQIDQAGQSLQLAVTHRNWARPERFNQLMIPLVRYFTVAQVDSGAFEETWLPLFERAQSSDPRLASARPLAQLKQAYLSEDIPVVIGPEDPWERVNVEIQSRYEDWSYLEPRFPNPEERRLAAFASFLKMVGDSYLRAGQAHLAVQRYALAYTLDPQQAEAALYLANALWENREQVDPEGQLRNRQIVALFTEKGAAYQSRDWRNIVRLHTILGQVFESEGRFGPYGDPRSAVFQWQHAIRAQEQLTGARGQTHETAPALFAKLANAQIKNDDDRAAWGNYIAAAEGFEFQGRIDDQKSIWAICQALPSTPPSQLRARWQLLDSKFR